MSVEAKRVRGRKGNLIWHSKRLVFFLEVTFKGKQWGKHKRF